MNSRSKLSLMGMIELAMLSTDNLEPDAVYFPPSRIAGQDSPRVPPVVPRDPREAPASVPETRRMRRAKERARAKGRQS